VPLLQMGAESSHLGSACRRQNPGCSCSHPVSCTSGPAKPLWHRVQLAVSPIGRISVPNMFQAYHTSIALGDTEYCFTQRGVVALPCFQSHVRVKGPNQVFEMGLTDISDSKLMAIMDPFFERGSYDILRKNCNSFTDCALFLLLGKRLQEEFREVDRLGLSADKLGLIRLLTMCDYTPNPLAQGFDTDLVLQAVAKRQPSDVSYSPAGMLVIENTQPEWIQT